MTASNPSLAAIFPISCRLANDSPTDISPADFPAYLAAHPHACGGGSFLPDLAAIEYACHQLSAANTPFPATVAARIINPTVQIIEVGWTGLPDLFLDPTSKPKRGRRKTHPNQLPLFGPGPDQVRAFIQRLSVDDLTPRQAMEALYTLKGLCSLDDIN